MSNRAHESDPPMPSPDLGRRKFLRLAMTLLNAVTWPYITRKIWVPPLLEHSLQKGVDVLDESDPTPALLYIALELDRAAEMMQREPGAPEVRRNDHYRPLGRIVLSAVTSYEEDTGKQVFYDRPSDYLPEEHYMEALRSILEKLNASEDGVAELRYLHHDFLMLQHDDIVLPDSAQELLHYSERTLTLEDSPPSPSGFYERVGHGVDLGSSLSESHTKHIEIVKQYVEELVRDNGGKPISSELLLTYFLHQNDGNLSASILDMMHFFKIMARVYFKTSRVEGNSDVTEEDFFSNSAQWMQANILDEFRKVASYQDLVAGRRFKYVISGLLERFGLGDLVGHTDQDLSAINAIGNPYHIFNELALQAVFPVKVVQVGIILRQLRQMRDQGLVKTAADIWGLVSLAALEELFSSRSIQ